MYGAKTMLLEEIKHRSLRAAVESAPCPNEAEEKDFLESDRLKVVTNLKKYQEETRAWRDPKVKLKQIQSWKSGAFAKPPHGEHRKIGSKVDMTIHGFRENEAGRLQYIRHSRKSLGIFLERREPSPFLYLNKNCKRSHREL
jgi:hypothetical protein